MPRSLESDLGLHVRDPGRSARHDNGQCLFWHHDFCGVTELATALVDRDFGACIHIYLLER